MRYILLVLVLPLLLSCENKKPVVIKGCIMDSISKKPIQNAKVTILCWYDAGWDKTDYQSIDVITKSDGNFIASFDEGYKAIVASIASNYNIGMREESIVGEKTLINLFLVKSTTARDVSKINLRKYIVSNGTN